MYVDLESVATVDTHVPQIAQGPNDLRGPCPGLNVMANHGYLPRDGLASVAQLTLASNKGMRTTTSSSVWVLTV
jgi:hypothetical protein